MSVWAIVAQAVGIGAIATIISIFAAASGRRRNEAAKQEVEAERSRLGK
jgi:hypothetical protein